MATLMTASRQWAMRPDEERFLNLLDLNAHQRNMRVNSRELTAPLNKLEAVHDIESNGMVFVGGKNKPATMSNYAFGQMANIIGRENGSFPAGFIQSLPPALAVQVVNHGLQSLPDSLKAQLLVSRPDDQSDDLNFRAINSETYGRIYNHQVTQGLVDRFGDGVTGDFKVPGEFGKDVPITTQNTTIYGGDRDMFVFLCDEKHKIKVPNRRNGEAGEMSRGFFVWNSEVGSATLGVATFLFDYVCSNRIVWGASDYKEIKLKHSLKAPERFLDEVSPMLTKMVEAKSSIEETLIVDAQNAKLDKDAREKLYRQLGINPKTGGLIDATHMREENNRPIESLWDMQVGITAYAKTIPYQAERVEIERIGGKVLDLVANK